MSTISLAGSPSPASDSPESNGPRSAGSASPSAQKIHHNHPVTPGKVLGWIFMVIILFITLFPFYWILRTAMSSNALLATRPGFLGPVGTNLGGFARVFGAQDVATAVAQGGSGASINFWRYLMNSVIVATVITVVQTLSCAMASYAFARLRWPGRNLVFGIFLASMMIPAIFTFLPNFILMRQLHLIDTLLGIMLPTLLISPFAVFFLRQFFMNISREVEEAALIDGASKPMVFWKLIIPMASAPMFTLGLLTYITAWNDYFWPLMVSYTDSSRVLNVALGVFRAQSPQSGIDWSGLMAATLVSALPMLILFACFAKRIVNSIGFTGIK